MLFIYLSTAALRLLNVQLQTNGSEDGKDSCVNPGHFFQYFIIFLILFINANPGWNWHDGANPGANPGANSGL